MITSIHNEKIKKVTGLQTKSKIRRKYKLFVVEGLKMIQEAPKEWIEEIYISENLYDHFYNQVEDLCNKIEVVSDDVFKHISTSVTPQGILALIKQPEHSFDKITMKHNPLIVALENMQDPGNLGTVIRTCEAANVDYVVLSKGTVDIYNPKVIRGTMGSVFRLNVLENVDLIEHINLLKENNINVYGAHLKGAKNHFDVDMTKGTCILIGNEGNGLTDEISELTDENVIIPILGKSESLNAALATGIIVYEGVRQRLQ